MDTFFTMDGFQFLLRWVHFLAGITWIGLLYYFNFVQGEWFKETGAEHKSAAVQKLVPRALWWFRWGAMFTFLAGLGILSARGHVGGFEIFKTSWGVLILTGSVLGTLMFLNVWLIIWPNQKIVIANASGKKQPGAAAAGAKAALASRTNTLFSIPMLFFMAGAKNLPLSVAYDFSVMPLVVALGVVIGACQLNGMIGKTGPITSVKGVIGSGFALTAVLFGIIDLLT